VWIDGYVCIPPSSVRGRDLERLTAALEIVSVQYFSGRLNIVDLVRIHCVARSSSRASESFHQKPAWPMSLDATIDIKGFSSN
jgi:hypothetical protein